MHRRCIALAFVVLAFGACGDDPSGPPPIALFSILAGSGQTGTVGEALPTPLTVHVLDRLGRPARGAVVKWRTEAGVLSDSTSETDEYGLASVSWTLGTRAGTHAASAELDGAEPLTFWAKAEAGPPTALWIREDSVRLQVLGDTASLSVLGEDVYGNQFVPRSIEWSTTDPAVAIVGQSGVIEARGEGSAFVGVKVGTLRDSTKVIVKSYPNAPVILSISPDTLVPGAVVTLRGERFGGPSADVMVNVAGADAVVLSVADEEIQARLPAEGAFACAPTGDHIVRVSVAGIRGARYHPVRVARRHVLNPGEAVLAASAAEARCNEFPAGGGRYLISVYNPVRSVGAITAFRLRGVGESAQATLPLLAAPPRPSNHTDPFRLPGRPADARTERETRIRILEYGRSLAARGTPIAARAQPAPDRAAQAPPTPGTVMSFRIPDIATRDLCSNFKTVRARVVHVGKRSIILEDVEAPLSGRIDSLFVKLGKEFDDVSFPILERYFGDPLALDQHLDANGRILMLFSHVVTAFRSVVGFVFPGDSFDRSSCQSSNEAEIFYGYLPTVAGNGFQGNTAANWFRDIRATAIHEAKHIASVAARLKSGAPNLEETWLEEATAMIAEELFGRQIFGYDQHDNTDYLSSIYCEVRPAHASAPHCAGMPITMLYHFAWLYDYYRSPTTRTPIGSTAAADGSFYGSGWSLVRWVIDHMASDEAAFLRALNTAVHRTGVANLEAAAGREFAEILGKWSLATALDDRAGFTPREPWLAHTSWNTVDVFRGLNDDFPDAFPRAEPLVVHRIDFGSFNTYDITLAGGTAVAFELSGDAGAERQLVELYGSEFAPPGSTLRIAIARID